jgi:hypothetical protein
MGIITIAEVLTLAASLLLAFPAIHLSFLLKKRRDVLAAVASPDTPTELKRYAGKWTRLLSEYMQTWNGLDHASLCFGVLLAVLASVLKLLA